MKYFVLLTILVFLALPALAASRSRNCFSHHIKESISINKERRSFYARLTIGKSDRIFNNLIAAESLSLIPATYLDFKAKPYIKNKIGIFCDEFVSMNRVPDFDPDNRTLPKEEFTPFNWQNYKIQIERAVDRNDFEAIKSISIRAIKSLERFPHYYCMVRHIFESIYRFAHFIPMHEKLAREKGVKAPTKLAKQAIQLQLLAIESSYKLDIWSAPIQAEGIPVLCAELPNLLSDLIFI